VAFDNRHEHRAEHTRSPERRQEAERKGKATAKLTEDNEACPERRRLQAHPFLHFHGSTETWTAEPAKKFLRPMRGKRQSGDQPKKKETEMKPDTHTYDPFPE
jgi:hypothetical protein